MNDEFSKDFMNRAIELAKKGEGRVNPNPLVGAVIVKNGRIIGEGYHHCYGNLHAEREALKNCYERGENPEGAQIYVTLEPCCHYGKQPPCTQALVEAKIDSVIVGSRDPNPLVHGKGNAFLREHGITVTEDFMREECDRLNPVFFHFITKKMPYVALKYAMTLDGKIATRAGLSKWISCEKSRNYVHILRNKYSGIMAGIGTVLADNPMLNCRLTDEEGNFTGRNPVRIICDSDLRLPLDSKLAESAKTIPLLVFSALYKRSEEKEAAFESKKEALEKKGIEVFCLKNEKNEHRVDLRQLMQILAEKNIDSLLVEGGGQLNYSILNENLAQKIYAFLSPKIFGGSGKSPVMGEGIEKVEEAFEFKLDGLLRIDDDIMLEYSKKA